VINILIESLPEAVEIEGQTVEIDSDFRAALRVILAFEDATLADLEKQAILLDNLYPTLPDNVGQAFEQGIKFLNGGEVDPDDEGMPGPRLYSFERDANLIFAAFRQTHGIDLQAVAQLHWWVFLALFNDLGAETTFCQLISLRKRVRTGKASKEEKQMARDMGEAFDVPDLDTRNLDEKEQEREFLRLIEEGQKQRA
jgi:hypothetical protein